MTGYLILLALAAAVLLGMWPWVRRDLGVLQFVGAAILVAFSGYALQGSQSMAGAPKAGADAPERPPSEFSMLRKEVFPQFDRAAMALIPVEAQLRGGYTSEAVALLHSELGKNPRDMVLWLALADALIQHNGDIPSPAAFLAFERAAQVAPNHPAPSFFYALAVARMGQLDQADGFLQRVLAMPETNDTWRELVGRARTGMAQMRGGTPAGP